MAKKFQIIHFNSVTSTQEIAKMIKKENVVILADEQKSAYGRNGRKWFSPIGGLWFTIILKGENDLIPLAAGVAIAKALKKEGIEVGIKWPNDIIYRGKKLAGIIAERSGEFVFLGIGINLKNEIPEELQSIAIALPDLDPQSLLENILNEIDMEKEKIIEEWKKYDVIIGKRICVENGERICGLAVDICEDGSLLIKTEKGEKRIYAGDVHIIQMGD